MPQPIALCSPVSGLVLEVAVRLGGSQRPRRDASWQVWQLRASPARSAPPPPPPINCACAAPDAGRAPAPTSPAAARAAVVSPAATSKVLRPRNGRHPEALALPA